MNIVFAGTPAFAVPSLMALIDSRHHVMGVYTQPDRPAGRGRKLTSSPIKIVAEQHQLLVHQPASLRDLSSQETLKNLMPDIIVVVAYGLLLPKAVLELPRFGCINVHPSLLPRWRGAAPIQRTVLAGDQRTGVAIMQLDTGMDTGPVFLHQETSVEPLETSGHLHDRLSVMGAALLTKALYGLEQGTLTPVAQSIEGITHAAKITKAEARLDWRKSALTLQHCVCGYNPAPVAYTTYNHQLLRIWQARCVSENKTTTLPGQIIQADKAGIDVATGQGVLRLLTVQLPGGKPMTAAEFLHKEQALIQHCVLGE